MPSDVVQDASYVHTDNNYTTTEKNKLAGIEAGATADQTASEILTAIKTVDGSGSGLDADLLDGYQGSNYGRFTNDITLNNSTTTADFITELTNEQGCFQNNYRAMKVYWSYSGNSNLNTGHSTIGTIELAGCLIEAWGGTYKHIRISRPNTGTGGQGVYEYNDQGSSYSPGWREIWTSGNDGSGSGLDADTVDGVQASQFARTDIAETFNSSVTATSFVGDGSQLTGIVEPADYATSTVGGTIKARLSGSDLYITFNGTDA